MSTLETVETTPPTEQPHRARVIAVVVTVVVVAVVAAVGIWAFTRDSGPVAAEEAQIELTFAGDDASYEGDREIAAGRGEVVFVNDRPETAWLVVQYYEPDWPLLETELFVRPEGSDFVLDNDPWCGPPGGSAGCAGQPGEAVVMQAYDPGRTTVGIELQPGTYFVEAALVEEETTHLWRAGVIEVVAE